ncbi:MAG: hypothetical protein FWC76_04045 [Defluviitaleaceae bacterium]|nr:hypothetical protein [Defluviitaleaceae bacterium]
MKHTVAGMLATILILSHIPALVWATHGFSAAHFTVSVEGELFETWGYDGDGPVPALRLHDIAYMLNGTSAQFDIRPISDDSPWDYWIVRGAPYTPTGNEFQPIPLERYAAFGSYGFFDWYGFDGYPVRTILVGFDGIDAPVTTIPMEVVRDIDGIYFNLWDIAGILGFSWDRYWCIVNDDTQYVFTPEPGTARYIPIQTPEFVHLLTRVSGQWVDAARYYSDIIDESVIWPVEFTIDWHGFTDFVSRPIAPFSPESRLPDEWYALSMRVLEDGLVEFTIDPTARVRHPWDIEVHGRPPEEALRDTTRFADYRIVVDTSREVIDEMTLYIEDTSYTMVRTGPWTQRDPHRYYAEPYEGGGIRLLYVARSNTFASWHDRIEIFGRNAETGVSRRLSEHIIEDMDIRDRILFEIIDDAAEFGQVYYYELWATRIGGSSFQVGSTMRVDVGEIFEVHGIPVPEEPEEEGPAPEIEEIIPIEYEVHEEGAEFMSFMAFDLIIMIAAVVVPAFLTTIGIVIGVLVYRSKNKK